MIAFRFFTDISNWSLWGLFAIAVLSVFYVRLSRHQGKWYLPVALLLIYLAVGSPLPRLADFGLHSVSMIQQFLILMIVPVLLLLSLPEKSYDKKTRFIPDFSSSPGIVFAFWISGAIAMWGGHFLSAAILSAHTGLAICGLHLDSGNPIGSFPESAVMGILLVAGLLFALPLFHPDPNRRIAPLRGIIYLFTACVSCSILGLYVAFSASSAHTQAVQPLFTTLRNPLPISPRADQEFAGMLMWVPGCLLYVTLSMGMMKEWYRNALPPKKKPETRITAAKNFHRLSNPDEKIKPASARLETPIPQTNAS